MTTARVFIPGQRVEFESRTSTKIFRGVVEEKLASGYYWVVHDGETHGRIVSGDRLRACLTFSVPRGHDAA